MRALNSVVRSASSKSYKQTDRKNEAAQALMEADAVRICKANKKTSELAGGWTQYEQHYYLYLCL